MPVDAPALLDFVQLGFILGKHLFSDPDTRIRHGEDDIMRGGYFELGLVGVLLDNLGVRRQPGEGLVISLARNAGLFRRSPESPHKTLIAGLGASFGNW